ncbi:MAG: C39 family peptidase [Cephaloticoccus sp.]|nr:C39 family peptidase [Akkermansiaceae bacterium]MCF7759401.1 C39 family peptidase [Cephaloticoccus sp.]
MALFRKPKRHHLQLTMQAQPDDTTCGPTCLHAVYRYWGEEVALDEVIASVPKLETGGTLGVLLGTDALRRGYQVTLYTYNLQVFDPTWFADPATDLVAKLQAQAQAKTSNKLRLASQAYVEFLQRGGQVKSAVLSGSLIRKHLRRNVPILTGLSSTWLYQAAREYGPNDDDDDIRGSPSGHFVVVSGYDRKPRHVHIHDPLQANPHSPTRRYSIDIDRVINSILLGVLTYDANLLMIEPADGSSHA